MAEKIFYERKDWLWIFIGKKQTQNGFKSFYKKNYGGR